MALQNTDLLLVGRGSTSHKIEYSTLKSDVIAGVTVPTVGNGQINVDGSDGISATGNNATANQSGNTTRTLSADEAWFNDRYLQLIGDTLTGAIRQTPQTIPNNGAWDLDTGNYWHFAGGTIANPTNATAGMSGLIYVTASITGWGTNFTNTHDAGSFPAVIPFYINADNTIRLGNPVEVG